MSYDLKDIIHIPPGEPYIKKSIADELAKALEMAINGLENDYINEPIKIIKSALGKYKKSIGEE